MVYKQTEQWISVLIIEDDHRIAEINRRFIEKIHGYEVVGVATNEEEAKEQLDILCPDLVLLDMYFPDMNGLDLLRYIKHHHSTDVIMITAGKEVESVREAIGQGIFDYIIKPVIFQRFEQTLSNYKNYREKVEKWIIEKESVNQEKIDELMLKSRKVEEKISYLPKGIDRLTLEKVSDVIRKRSDGLTADEVGKEIGASRSTARRYLEYLVSKGDVAADLSYGVVGRPERVYILI
ncbi:response regulator [Priestia abyssalis]|uniref:response regulator n=1 Tax=Priestia abyssalis TaxID=1221450 RepID=UPI000995B6C5|nr:response regulator [Priestia abyssalis]